MDAAEFFSAPQHERKELERKFPDIAHSKAYYALVSLHNLCECRLQRRKVEERRLSAYIDNNLRGYPAYNLLS